MKMLTTFRTATLKAVAGATLVGVAFSLPTLAQANDYNNGYRSASQDCRAQENEAQLIGGLLGAVIGGVAGSQVSGNGARTEGSVIGVVLGGLAGAAIGDESVDCNKRRRAVYQTTNYTGQTYRRAPAPIVYGGRVTTRRVVQPRTVRHNYGNSYNYNNNYRNDRQDRRYKIRTQLQDVRYRLQELREKQRRVERKLRRNYRQHLVNKSARIGNEIHRLQRKKRRLKNRLANLRNNY